MCGITGIVAFSESGRSWLNRIDASCRSLAQRGPDHEGICRNNDVALGHRRLSVIDTSDSAHQPMSDASGRFTIVYNGEFFNYREHRNQLLQQGEQFVTHSDTEVLLRLYMREGPDCLKKVNGFFAFAIYDALEKSVFIARDRMGIKPLFYYFDSDKLIFGSEMKALIAAGVPKVPDVTSMLNYFQLNYVPGPHSIFENVKKLKPGHFIVLKTGSPVSTVSETCYYQIPGYRDQPFRGSYEEACAQLRTLLDLSVQRRLVADVPLGAFLSGGIDSSVIVALASKYTSHLNTFSIGYKDEPGYDETSYARLVADKYKTNHTVFSLSNDDLFANLFSVLDYIDEPFADSSALAVNILSMHTRKHVTVALSGDGADEMFAGYNKHKAEWMLRNRPLFRTGVRMLSPLLSSFGGARNTAIGNKIRQLHRFADGAAMSASDRYWRWCSFADEKSAASLLLHSGSESDYLQRKKMLLSKLGNGADLNDFLYMDMNMVLTNDMLVKVDLMSMANSLEVRVPFLDYEVVNFAFSIPSSFKMTKDASKKILRETFRKDLPEALFHRGKHGFEVPLLKWFRTGLKSLITDDLLEPEFIRSQGIFDPAAIEKLKLQLFSDHPGEIEARMWGLIVFQYWWKKYML